MEVDVCGWGVEAVVKLCSYTVWLRTGKCKGPRSLEASLHWAVGRGSRAGEEVI